jgi:2-methylcitrate dehydratase PrpD
VETKIGLGLNPRHYDLGWHATSTLGTLGAAAACAKLLSLDVEKTA